MDNYNINRKDYDSHLRELMTMMMNTNDFTDVSLVCDDDNFEFRAHKVILSSCSESLSKIISQTQGKDPLIYLRGISSWQMQCLMEFMYLGRTMVYQNNLQDFLNAAQNLKVKGIGPEMSLEKNTPKMMIKAEGPQSKQRVRKRINSQVSQVSSQAIKDNPPDAKAIIDPDILMDEYFDETVPFEFDEAFDEDLVFEEETSWKASNDESPEDVTVKTEDQSFQFDFLTDENVTFYASGDSEEIDEPFFNVDSKDKLHQTINKEEENKPADVSLNNSTYTLRERKSTHKKAQNKDKPKKAAHQCPQCDKTFTQAANVKVHVKTVHQKQIFKCQFCDKSRTTQGNLNQHIKKCHSDKFI